MTPTEFTAIGVDVGGTKVAAGVVTFPGGHIQATRVFATNPARGGNPVLEELVGTVHELSDACRAQGRHPDGLGIGICEIVDSHGQIASDACLPWTTQDLTARLSSVAPVTIEADVRAAARAEALLGAGRGFSSFLYVSIGTGIACCLVIDGEPYLGARGATGTMASGPMPGLHPDLPPSPGVSLEAMASGPGLVRRYVESGGIASSAQEVLALGRAGDPRAHHVLTTAATLLGGTIGTLVNVLDPGSVVLGGGVGAAPGFYHEEVVQAIRRHVWWTGHRDIAITPSALATDAGMIGAAATAWLHRSRAAAGARSQPLLLKGEKPPFPP